MLNDLSYKIQEYKKFSADNHPWHFSDLFRRGVSWEQSALERTEGFFRENFSALVSSEYLTSEDINHLVSQIQILEGKVPSSTGKVSTLIASVLEDRKTGRVVDTFYRNIIKHIPRTKEGANQLCNEILLSGHPIDEEELPDILGFFKENPPGMKRLLNFLELVNASIHSMQKVLDKVVLYKEIPQSDKLNDFKLQEVAVISPDILRDVTKIKREYERFLSDYKMRDFSVQPFTLRFNLKQKDALKDFDLRNKVPCLIRAVDHIDGLYKVQRVVESLIQGDEISGIGSMDVDETMLVKLELVDLKVRTALLTDPAIGADPLRILQENLRIIALRKCLRSGWSLEKINQQFFVKAMGSNYISRFQGNEEAFVKRVETVIKKTV